MDFKIVNGRYLHSHITDNVLGDGRFQKLPQDLKAMEQCVRLIEVISTAISTVKILRSEPSEVRLNFQTV